MFMRNNATDSTDNLIRIEKLYSTKKKFKDIKQECNGSYRVSIKSRQSVPRTANHVNYKHHERAPLQHCFKRKSNCTVHIPFKTP